MKVPAASGQRKSDPDSARSGFGHTKSLRSRQLTQEVEGPVREGGSRWVGIAQGLGFRVVTTFMLMEPSEAELQVVLTRLDVEASAFLPALEVLAVHGADTDIPPDGRGLG